MKIKNVSGQDRVVPWLGNRMVLDGQPVDIPDHALPPGVTVFAFTQQEGIWSPADEEAEAVHAEGLEACAYALAVQGRVGELLVKTGSAREITRVLRDPATPLEVVVEALATELRDAAAAGEEPRSSVVSAAEKRLEAEAEPEPVPHPSDPGNSDPGDQGDPPPTTEETAGTTGEGSDV